MKNLILTTAITLLSFNAFANRDSVAFFYTPKKVTVLITERRDQGSRIFEFLQHFESESSIAATSIDETIKLKCALGTEAATCNFTFIPGYEVRIQDRALAVTTSVQSLKLNNNGAFEMAFTGSMKDTFSLQISENGDITMTGSKK